MANTVNFKIQLEVDGKQHVVKAVADIGDLKKEISSATELTNRLYDSFTHLASVSVALDGLTNVIGQMERGLKELTNAYAVQEQNEKRLETVMRERMDASAADIQQMKELASAQQDIGVIGDEVQLAGMQQVSTFLHEKEALEELVPAMNNLIAQQNGLNATQQDAQSIGSTEGAADESDEAERGCYTIATYKRRDMGLRLSRNIRRKRRWLESSIPPWHRKFSIHDLAPYAIKENNASDYNYNRRPKDHPRIIGEKAYSHHYPSDEAYEGNEPTGEYLLHIIHILIPLQIYKKNGNNHQKTG